MSINGLYIDGLEMYNTTISCYKLYCTDRSKYWHSDVVLILLYENYFIVFQFWSRSTPINLIVSIEAPQHIFANSYYSFGIFKLFLPVYYCYLFSSSEICRSKRRLIFPIQLFKMICRYYCHPTDLLTYQQQYRMSNINNISNRMSAINETRPTVIQNHTERETKKKCIVSRYKRYA